jgi:hypothetical protein
MRMGKRTLVIEGLSVPPPPPAFLVRREGGATNWLWFQSITEYFLSQLTGKIKEIISYLEKPDKYYTY